VPAWASVTPHGSNYYSANNTQLDVNSVETSTGITYYASPNPYTTVETLATITLAGSVPSAFQLGLLDDNTTNSGSDTELTVTDTQGGASPTSLDSSGGNKNNFYLFDVNGATAGDVITITGTAAYNGSNTALGGIAFDVVPEPAALSLLGISAMGLLVRRRRTAKQ
jgi:hypothetical protein